MIFDKYCVLWCTTDAFLLNNKGEMEWKNTLRRKLNRANDDIYLQNCRKEILTRECNTLVSEENEQIKSPSIRVDVVGNIQAFGELKDRLDVVARAQPIHKYALVVGLKALGSVVAVTGDGANDALALKKADVGIAMGLSGKQVAKQAADIILFDEKFESIVKAVLWGRNIYENISRFLKFQLTVNISTVLLESLGTLFLGTSLFTTPQLLWVNLIMDTVASLALATEPPSLNSMRRPPCSKMDPLVTQVYY
jgi:P-type Ca2+ transporter type 2B